MKLKYHLDHPQLKRKKSLGNGSTPSSSSGGMLSKIASAVGLGGSKTSQQAKETGADRHEGTKGGTGDMRTNFSNLIKKK